MSKGISKDGYNIEIISSRKSKEVKIINLDTEDIRILGYRPKCDDFNFYPKKDRSQFDENYYLGKKYTTKDGINVVVKSVEYRENGNHLAKVENIENGDIREIITKRLQKGDAVFYPTRRKTIKVGDTLNLYSHSLIVKLVEKVTSNKQNSNIYRVEYKGKQFYLRNENISGGVYPTQLKHIDLIGQSGYNRQGIKLTIKDYNKENKTYVIVFEDGTIVEKSARMFYTNIEKQGDFYVLIKNIQEVPHPEFHTKCEVGNLKLSGLAYRLEDNKDTYYYCECSKCGLRSILSPSEMLKHVCQEVLDD